MIKTKWDKMVSNLFDGLMVTTNANYLVNLDTAVLREP